MYLDMTIIGNLGSDPEMQYLANGTPVTNFSVAVNRRWKDRDGVPQEETTWFRVTCWNKLAETTYQYLRKGRLVMVKANRLKAGPWIDRDGNARASLEITALDVKFLSGGSTAPLDEDDIEPAAEEDIPF